MASSGYTAKQMAFFTRELLYWHYNLNNRTLPWKEEKDPYRIWLSEIILQQTRAEQGLPYYEKFILKYPTVRELAAAPDDEVMLLWQGLGYYSRCRNLLAAARMITEEFHGHFPDNYEDILRLKGVGPYTAAAIASFGFGIPKAVVDGNVLRVLSRYFEISEPIDKQTTRKYISDLANRLIDTKAPGAFNQAIMDFGATICKPQQPLCPSCILKKHCVALQHQTVELLPFSEKKIKVITRYLHFFLLAAGDKIYIRLRTGNDIWKGLYELYLVETENDSFPENLPPFLSDHLKGMHLPSVYQSRQRLTHQLIIARFYTIPLPDIPGALKNDGLWISKKNWKNFAFSKTILSFLKRNA